MFCSCLTEATATFHKVGGKVLDLSTERQFVDDDSTQDSEQLGQYGNDSSTKAAKELRLFDNDNSNRGGKKLRLFVDDSSIHDGQNLRHFTGDNSTEENEIVDHFRKVFPFLNESQVPDDSIFFVELQSGNYTGQLDQVSTL